MVADQFAELADDPEGIPEHIPLRRGDLVEPHDGLGSDGSPVQGAQLRPKTEFHEGVKRTGQFPTEPRVQGSNLDQGIDARGCRIDKDTLVDGQRPDTMHDWEYTGSLEVDLVRADTHRCHDRAEDTKVRGREGLDQVCEMRQEGSLAAHEIDERFLCADDKVRVPSDRDGVEEDGDVHGGCRIAAEHPGLELADKALDGLRPDRVANHHVAGAGREAEVVERSRERLAERCEIGNAVDVLAAGEVVVRLQQEQPASTPEPAPAPAEPAPAPAATAEPSAESTPVPATGSSSSGGGGKQLPRTGAPAGLVLAAGAVLLLGGLLLRRSTGGARD